MSQPILEMKGISKSFYGSRVLDQVDFSVLPGEVHILLGENGAGKSTLVKILSGAYSYESGTILLDGIDCAGLDPSRALKQGISVIYQEFNLFPELSICENIFMGKMPGKGFLAGKKEMTRLSQIYMDKVGLQRKPAELVKNLSVGEQQLVEIAKAISNKVRVLVLDEPTAALSDRETQMLFSVIDELKKEGIGIIYISHRMSEFFQIGDRCSVMRDGRMVGTVRISETDEGQLTEMMVGHAVEVSRGNKQKTVSREAVLRVSHLSCQNYLRDVSLTLHRGEILGVTGLIGSGQTQLGKCIMGLLHAEEGSVLYQGKPVSANTARNIRRGLVYLSEDRKEEGLVQIHSLTDNVTLPSLRKLAHPFLKKKEMAGVTQQYIRKLNIKTDSAWETVQNLSGGNQQKAVIAKWLYAHADVYIFNEPTRGIDVGAREEIYRIMREIVKDGASILMISSDMEEILQMSDRIIVMKDGRIRRQTENKKDLNQSTILRYAMQEETAYAS